MLLYDYILKVLGLCLTPRDFPIIYDYFYSFSSITP